jgi:hypothetical protein
MSEDARFEDGADRPLKLRAEDISDLEVISSLIQDSIIVPSEISWTPKDRRFALLINRFRWEDKTTDRNAERVQSVLAFDDISRVSAFGVDQHNPKDILSLLGIGWKDLTDASGNFELAFSGGKTLSLESECINVILQDVTRPYVAPSNMTPEHPEA